MRILISNDDGYFAPGIEHLALVLGARHDVTVVAPERDRSGASNSLTLDRPLMVRRAPNGFMFVNGPPTMPLLPAAVWINRPVVTDDPETSSASLPIVSVVY